MGRKKKVKDTLVKKAKKASAKRRPTNKAPYVSKAERAQLELNSDENSSEKSGSVQNSSDQ